MADFIKVAKIADLPNGKMNSFKVNGKQITVANTDGEYMAFDDGCTHAQCSLAGGYLAGNTITCYCHGAQFDVKTGKVLAPPATVDLKVYNTKVEGVDILIEI